MFLYLARFLCAFLLSVMEGKPWNEENKEEVDNPLERKNLADYG